MKLKKRDWKSPCRQFNSVPGHHNKKGFQRFRSKPLLF